MYFSSYFPLNFMVSPTESRGPWTAGVCRGPFEGALKSTETTAMQQGPNVCFYNPTARLRNVPVL